jgi:pyrroline-5-carboxylate reductase
MKNKMNRVGFIGYGSMGSMLVNGFLTAEVIAPEEMVISNRSITKLETLTDQWKGITVSSDNRSVARESNLLFLCVKPLEVLPVLQEIKSDLKISTHLISIAACVTIHDIENQFPGPVTKIIPSLTSEVKEGISLLCHNAEVSEDRKKRLENLLGAISKVIQIKETDFEAAADLTSCAPGLFAAIFENFVQAGLRHSEIPPDVAHQMVVATLFGTAKLMAKKGIGFLDMIQRVATKGGITEEGVKVLNTHLPAVFDEVFHKTLSKHDFVKDMIKQLKDNLQR